MAVFVKEGYWQIECKEHLYCQEEMIVIHVIGHMVRVFRCALAAACLFLLHSPIVTT